MLCQCHDRTVSDRTAAAEINRLQASAMLRQHLDRTVSDRTAAAEIN
jgi:hypothetical protein